MLRRVNSALFEAPRGARIQIVAEAQGNPADNQARFEYARKILRKETILGLPGCSFTVADSSETLEAVVVFDPSAPASARYDLFQVENGVKSDLRVPVTHSQSSPLISFTIEPVAVAARRGPVRPAAARAAEKAAKKKAAKKKAAKKKTPRKNVAATKKAAKKKTRGRKTAARRQTASRRRTSRRRVK